MANYNERQLNNGEQGEGSGLNADKVDNSEGSELGNTIDGSSITENAQGEIQADPSIRDVEKTLLTEKTFSNVSAGVYQDFSGFTSYGFYIVRIAVKNVETLRNIGLKVDDGSQDGSYQHVDYAGNYTSGLDALFISSKIGNPSDGNVVVDLMVKVGYQDGYKNSRDRIMMKPLNHLGSYGKSGFGQLSASTNNTWSVVVKADNVDSISVKVFELTGGL